MLPLKRATTLAHRFVSTRPHLVEHHLSEIDRRAVVKLAQSNGIPPEVLLSEVEVEIDWAGHTVPCD